VIIENLGGEWKLTPDGTSLIGGIGGKNIAHDPLETILNLWDKSSIVVNLFAHYQVLEGFTINLYK
jgi:hypothetical protein